MSAPPNALKLIHALESVAEAREQAEDQGESENPTQVRLAQLRAALVDSVGLDSIPDPVPLIDGVLFRDSLAWIYGKPGSGKSFVALDMAGSIGTGRPWHGLSVSRGKVVYVVAEGVSGQRKRVRAWEQERGQAMTDVAFLPVAVQLLNGVDLQAFVTLVAEEGPAMVVLDTQARVTVGADENSNGEMSKVVAAADRLREASGACVLLVHHSGKSGLDMRGASAFEGAATSVLKVGKDGDWLDILCEKQKDIEAFPPMRLHLASAADSVVPNSATHLDHVISASANQNAILAELRHTFGSEGASPRQLKDATEIAERSLYRELNAMVSTGGVVKTGKGRVTRYYVPEHDPNQNSANSA